MSLDRAVTEGFSGQRAALRRWERRSCAVGPGWIAGAMKRNDMWRPAFFEECGPPCVFGRGRRRSAVGRNERTKEVGFSCRSFCQEADGLGKIRRKVTDRSGAGIRVISASFPCRPYGDVRFRHTDGVRATGSTPAVCVGVSGPGCSEDAGNGSELSASARKRKRAGFECAGSWLRGASFVGEELYGTGGNTKGDRFRTECVGRTGCYARPFLRTTVQSFRNRARLRRTGCSVGLRYRMFGRAFPEPERRVAEGPVRGPTEFYKREVSEDYKYSDASRIRIARFRASCVVVRKRLPRRFFSVGHFRTDASVCRVRFLLFRHFLLRGVPVVVFLRRRRRLRRVFRKRMPPRYAYRGGIRAEF